MAGVTGEARDGGGIRAIVGYLTTSVRPRWTSHTCDHQHWRRTGIMALSSQMHQGSERGLSGSSSTCLGHGIRATQV